MKCYNIIQQKGTTFKTILLKAIQAVFIFLPFPIRRWWHFLALVIFFVIGDIFFWRRWHFFGVGDIFWRWWHFLVFHSGGSQERGLVFIYEQQNIISQFHAKHYISKIKHYPSWTKNHLLKKIIISQNLNIISQKQNIILQFHAKHYLLKAKP